MTHSSRNILSGLAGTASPELYRKQNKTFNTLTSACLHVIQEAARGTPSCADAVLKVTRLRKKSFLRFEAAEAV